jgi:hypothetical protein
MYEGKFLVLVAPTPGGVLPRGSPNLHAFQSLHDLILTHLHPSYEPREVLDHLTEGLRFYMSLQEVGGPSTRVQGSVNSIRTVEKGFGYSHLTCADLRAEAG